MPITSLIESDEGAMRAFDVLSRGLRKVRALPWAKKVKGYEWWLVSCSHPEEERTMLPRLVSEGTQEACLACWASDFSRSGLTAALVAVGAAEPELQEALF